MISCLLHFLLILPMNIAGSQHLVEARDLRNNSLFQLTQLPECMQIGTTCPSCYIMCGSNIGDKNQFTSQIPPGCTITEDSLEIEFSDQYTGLSEIAFIFVTSSSNICTLSQLYAIKAPQYSQNVSLSFTTQETDVQAIIEQGSFIFNAIDSIQLSNIIFLENQGITVPALQMIGVDNMIIDQSQFLNITLDQDASLAAIQIYNQSNVQISNSQFTNNSGGRGGAISAQENSSLVLLNCSFLNNSGGLGGGAILLQTSTLETQSCTFNNNIALGAGDGGAIGLLGESTYQNSFNTSFQSNQAVFGGAIYCSNSSITNTSYFNYVNNTANLFGGAVYIQGATYIDSPFCNFSQNIALSAGGAIFSTASNYSSAPNCLFTQNNCGDSQTEQGSGGAIYLAQSSYSNSPNSSFIQNTAWTSGGALSIYASLYSNSSFSIFQDNQALSVQVGQGGAIILTQAIYNSSQECIFINNQASIGGALLIQSSFYQQGHNNVFQGNKASYYTQGGILNIQNSTYDFADNCSFVANYGGAVILENSTYSNSNNCIFINNTNNFTYKVAGSAISQINSIYQNANNCSFIGNSAYWGGAVFVDNSIHQNLTDFTFINNTAIQEGAALVIMNSSIQNVDNFIFDGNSVQQLGGALTIFNSTIQNANNWIFANNQVNAVQFIVGILGGAMYVTYSNMSSISNFTFINNTLTSDGYGGALYVSDSVFDNVSNFQFINNSVACVSGLQKNCLGGGSCIYLYQGQAFQAKSFSFIENKSGGQGGGLYLAGIWNSSIQSFGNFSFMNNSALQGGGAYFYSPYLPITIQNNQTLNFSNAIFKNNFASECGGGLAIINVPLTSITIQQVTFQGNRAAQGGGFYNDLGSNITILDSQFLQNEAFEADGGAISFLQRVQPYLQPVQIYVISSQFESNKANLAGGGVYFFSQVFPSNITISNSQFTGNDASIGGGFSSKQALLLQLLDNQFTENTASQQGGAVHSYIFGQIAYQYLPPPNGQQILNPFTISSNTFDSNSAQQLAGGLYLDYSEAQLQLVGSLHFSILNFATQSLVFLQLSLNNNTFINNSANYGGAAIRINGLNISNITDPAAQGSCPYLQNLVFSNNFLTNNIAPDYQYYSPQTSHINNEVVSCLCIYGERYEINGENQALFCKPCPKGTYLNQSTVKVVGSCMQCPQGFNCVGGFAYLQLIPGYWSHSNLTVKGNMQSNQSFVCSMTAGNRSACLGYKTCIQNSDLCTADSVCDIRYSGPECQLCNTKQQYYSLSQNQCEKCTSNVIIILKLLGVLIVILVLLVISLKGTYEVIYNTLCIKILRIGFDYIIVNRDNLTAMMRIFISYLQNMSFFFLLQFQIPGYLANFIDFLKTFGQPLQPLSNSYECLLKNVRGSTSASIKYDILLTQFFSSLVLQGVIVLILVIYYVICKILQKRQSSGVFLFIIPSVVYLYLEFLPTLYYNSLSFLSCRTIADQKFIIGDSQFSCDTMFEGPSKTQALPIFLFQLSIPICLLGVLVFFRSKELLYKPLGISSCKYQLGYLYLGYRKDCYYWEFIRIAQRMLIMTTFLTFYDYDTQKGCLVVLILLAYSLLVRRVQPEDNQIVQTLELLSNYLQIFSFVAGVILQAKVHDVMQTLLTFSILILNICFIIYSVTIMLPNGWIEVNLFLAQFRMFQRIGFIKRFLERQRMRRVTLENWNILRSNLKAILAYGIQETYKVSQGGDLEMVKFVKLREKSRRRIELLMNQTKITQAQEQSFLIGSGNDQEEDQSGEDEEIIDSKLRQYSVNCQESKPPEKESLLDKRK